MRPPSWAYGASPAIARRRCSTPRRRLSWATRSTSSRGSSPRLLRILPCRSVRRRRPHRPSKTTRPRDPRGEPLRGRRREPPRRARAGARPRHPLRRRRGVSARSAFESATNLATAFTRAFPQAASADSFWLAVPFGPAGVANVTLVLDDEGTLASSTVDGSPSSPLRRGISRTIALLGTRAFTAHGAITRLRVIAHVTRDDLRDGLHGDVFALSGGSFAGDVGAAFFALPARGGAGPGRRVDILLRLVPDN